MSSPAPKSGSKATRAKTDRKAIYDALGIDPAHGGPQDDRLPPQSSVSTRL